jgi:hypothetical protein
MAYDGTRVFVVGGYSFDRTDHIYVFDTSMYFSRHSIWTASKIKKTEDIRYPEPEPKPNTSAFSERTVQSAGSLSQEQPKRVLKDGDSDRLARYVRKSRHLILLLKALLFKVGR